ncbi:circadian clock KaiB family protein [Leptothermofonsia sp. ETS-13]|uniref:circadian clock KaiB family protein n=1 Tax=Leptothermofonsia sp. ETS-13 TaxID=3035696 RepID=UPI003BA0F0B2
MDPLSKSSPELFKGIALFTPAGDLVYCSDPNKQNRWHLHLCMMLRDILGLSEPPHFLVPCYTATVDRWLAPYSSQVQTFAEAAPAILRYQPLLNQIFGTGNLVWHPTSPQEGLCDPAVLSVYRNQFPQLWETHDLIVQCSQTRPKHFGEVTGAVTATPIPTDPIMSIPLHRALSRTTEPPQGYVFRLFVSGSSTGTERILQNLYQFLEKSLSHPYTLKVIDVTQHPELAEQDQISATPTLVRVYPLPVRRVVGNLESVDHLLGMMGMLDEGRGRWLETL